MIIIIKLHSKYTKLYQHICWQYCIYLWWNTYCFNDVSKEALHSATHNRLRSFGLYLPLKIHQWYEKTSLTTRNVSKGHKCPHFFTFVTKYLKKFWLTDEWTMVNLNVPLPLKSGGIKNTLQNLSNPEHVKCLSQKYVWLSRLFKLVPGKDWPGG